MLGMIRRPTVHSSIARFAIALLTTLVALGCSKWPEIARYQVPKETRAAAKPVESKPTGGAADADSPAAPSASDTQRDSASPSSASPSSASPSSNDKAAEAADAGESAKGDRMLAAIVPIGDAAWFFKLAGDNKAVGQHAKAFEEVVESVTFAEDGEPQWKQPEGWQRQAGNQFRYATLLIPGDDGGAPLELTVSRLPWNAAAETDAVLANVNRWRGQMTLPPLGANELETETRKLKLADGEAILADLEGTLQAGGMRPPFAAPRPAGREN